MLEFSRMSVKTTDAICTEDNLIVGLAQSPFEIEQAQRLRFDVFSEEMDVIFPEDAQGIDQDQYDQWCEHLIVKEESTGRVIGTYRILTPEKAALAGFYYSESEFDLSGLKHVRHKLVEFGRSCTHKDFRSGSVIMLLWKGLAEFLRRGRYRYVLGCASVSLRDGGQTAAGVYQHVVEKLNGEPIKNLVVPYKEVPNILAEVVEEIKIPPLIKGYLKVGASVCGEPAWDPDFNVADFPMLLCIDEMDDRYRKHFDL